MGGLKWIKLYTEMPDHEKMKFIDAMKERDSIHYVWIRLIIQAGKINLGGKILLNQNTPYTIAMLCILLNRPIEEITFALKTLANFNMIEIDERGIITITNWSKYQNIEGMEKVREQTRKRVERYRSKNNIEESEEENFYSNNCNVTVTEQNKREKEKEKEKEKKIKNQIEEKTDQENDPVNQVVYNTFQENYIKGDGGYGISKDLDIMEYIKNTSSKFVGTTPTAVKSAVSIHGERNVKLAVDIAAEIKIFRMKYINGILNNWKREGYPYDKLNNPIKDYKIKNNKGHAFNNFEPRTYDYNALERSLLGWDEK